MFTFSLSQLQDQAKVSQHLWVKVVGMLDQNWCVLEPGIYGGTDMVFFDDRGRVFDWLSEPDLPSAQKALLTNGFTWMWKRSSFYYVSGVPKLPAAGKRDRHRPVYSSGDFWKSADGRYGYSNAMESRVPMHHSADDLQRFVDAQDGVWFDVIEELAAADKKTHWMWFIFPQLRGLGNSDRANYFGLASPAEAAKYWDDEVLGGRLCSCLEILLDLPDHKRPEDIFGQVDALKLQSCLTIFENSSYQDDLVGEALDRFFGGERCSRTLELISKSAPA